MFTNLNNNKWQIFISTSIGIIYFNVSKNEAFSMILVLCLSIMLRNLKIDNYINKYLENKSKNKNKNIEKFLN